MGQCYQELKRDDEALVEYKHAIELNDPHIKQILYQASYFVCNYYKKRNNEKDALPYILKCAEYGEGNEVPQFNAGIGLLKANRFEEAIVYFDNALKINRTNIHAQYNKGMCLLNLEKYEEAMKIFCLLIQMNPKDYESQYYKGICQIKIGKYSDALQTLNKLISINPKYFQAYLQRGIANVNLKAYGSAVGDFVTFDKNNQGHKEYDFYYYRALCLINSNKIEDAINDLNKAIAINPKKGNSHFKLGFCYLKRKIKEDFTKTLEKAIKEFNLAIQFDDKNIEAYYNKAIALASLKKIPEAIQSYEKIMELSPKDAESLFNKSLLLIKIEKYSLAEKDLLKTIEILNKYKSPFAKNLYNIYYNLGLCQNNQSKYKEAIESLTSSISLHKNFADSYYQIALAFKELKQYENALS